jgi:hypothetical protein
LLPIAWPHGISHRKNKTALAIATIAVILVTIVISDSQAQFVRQDFALPRVSVTSGAVAAQFLLLALPIDWGPIWGANRIECRP